MGYYVIGGHCALVGLLGVEDEGVKQEEELPKGEIGCVGVACCGAGAGVMGLCNPFKKVCEGAVTFEDGGVF